MSHERTITVGADVGLGSKFYNLATVDKKKKRTLGVGAAIDKARKEGKLDKGYLTEDAAIEDARQRSRAAHGFSAITPKDDEDE